MCDYLVAENSSVGKVRKYDQCLEIFENQNDLINDNSTGHGEGCAKTVTHPYKPKQHLHEKEIPHKCEVCSVCKKTAAGLAKHKFDHHQKLLFQCEMCPYNFPTALFLEQHTKSKHEKKCDLCYKTFKTQPDLTNHKKIEHAAFEMFSCPSCVKLSPLLPKLENIIYKCNQCDNACTSMENFLSHKYHVHSQGMFQCKDCSKKFKLDLETVSKKKKPMTNTKKSEFSHRSLTCQVCHKTFTSLFLLNNHKKIEHTGFSCYLCRKRVSFPTQPGSLTYNCDQCANTYKVLDNFILHKQSVHAQKWFLCENCSKKFKLKLDLKTTTKSPFAKGKEKSFENTEEPEISHRSFTCKVCHKTFTSLFLLNNHEKIEHIGFSCYSCRKRVSFPTQPCSLTYNCDQCANTYKVLGNFILHKQYAHAQKSFLCENCSKKFKFKLDLKTTTKRPFAKGKEKLFENTEKPEISHRWLTCKVCHKTFASRFLLNNHEKIEHIGFSCYSCRKRVSFPTQPGSLAYNCDQCANTYKVLDNFILHKQSVHAQKWFLCENCSENLIKYGSQPEKKNVVEKDFKCEVCRRDFSTKRFLTNHIKLEHTIDGRFSCRSCGKQFSFPTEPGNLTYKCDDCDYTCKTMKHLISHNYYIHWQRTFQCEDCSKDGVVLNLETHLTNLSDHKQEQEETFEEVSVKEEPLEWYDPEVNVKEEMDVKEEPEEVD